jgi:hypothetical protein
MQSPHVAARSRRYGLVLLIATLGVVLCGIGISVTLDPYRIVHPLLGEFAFQPNSRVSKLRYLVRACHTYNAYYVGSSRSGPLTDKDLSPAGAALKFYNLSTPVDAAPAIVRRVKWLLDQGCPLSALVIEEPLNILPDANGANDNSLLLSESPSISGESWVSFYSRFFMSAQPLITYVDVRRRSPLHRVFYPDGHVDYLWTLHDDTGLLGACHAITFDPSQPGLLNAKLAAYRELAQLAVDRGFAAVVWISPMNRAEATQVLAYPQIAAFLRELRAIPHLSVVEPAWTSSMLADFRYWHDCGHFRPEVFDQLLAPKVAEALDSRLRDLK